jgi:predicted nucleic acid-binding protein
VQEQKAVNAPEKLVIVVSDTTVITTLLKTGDEGLLAKLFGTVIVPPAVWDELRAFHSSLPVFIEVRSLSHANRPAGSERLGSGEVEAMQLAMQINADWLLLDDRQARAIATKLGIRCVALTGLLIKAKQLGHVRSVRALLERLEQRGGLYLSDAVKEEALRQAGE